MIPPDRARIWNPGGGASTRSPWLIQTWSSIWQPGKKRIRVQQINHCLAEFALVPRHDDSAQAPGHELQAVTDA